MKGGTQTEVGQQPLVANAIERGFMSVQNGRVIYNLNHKKSYNWNDPEEQVRAHAIAFLILQKGYPANRMRTEVRVPRRTPNDFADILVYRDDACRLPYLVVECKSPDQSSQARAQAIEQLFGNANSLDAPLGLYDEFTESIFFDVDNFPPTERVQNRKGSRDAVPEQYGEVPTYTFIAGGAIDIKAAQPKVLTTKIRRAHSIIWAGGKRDPLTAFDEWSKLLFAKVEDERTTPNGHPRRFQVGTSETTATVASRVHQLFDIACRSDRTIFPEGTRIDIPDKKVFEVVSALQDISIVDTSTDTIGSAFESFFGSVFRGELGQYFTMRQIARFTVAMLNISHQDYVIDPTSGSGGFLLETLLQVWHRLDADFRGREELSRLKTDFALQKVYGIEIHEILARICKINLLLHHDGHTNIEGNRSCLDSTFVLPRLRQWKGKFSRVVGNPPFGDEVKEGDEDQLGSNSLDSFVVADGKTALPSEHVILERGIDMLEPGGELGFVLPDGLFNNQGDISNCPQMRRFLSKNGKFMAIVSLPDFAFRKSGAQNKTSILFYRKFTQQEKAHFDKLFSESLSNDKEEDEAIGEAMATLNYKVFLAEADHIGYTPSGAVTSRNDLYRPADNGGLAADQGGTILGEFRRFSADPAVYEDYRSPDCIALDAAVLWNGHRSHRLDPKYFIFKHQETITAPDGWVRAPISKVMRRREEVVHPEERPEEPVKVITISQTGELRPREAGKGNNPPEWLGMYFEESPSEWYRARTDDVVFSSIDLWKGCISVVGPDFDQGLVTKEFPIYEIIDKNLDPEFLSTLLRSRYFQRAFRAITTGHSNRRRTQREDFEELEIIFPESIKEQKSLVRDILEAKRQQKEAAAKIKNLAAQFSQVIDGRAEEENGSFQEEEYESDDTKTS